jgi:hypothetical protein
VDTTKIGGGMRGGPGGGRVVPLPRPFRPLRLRELGRLALPEPEWVVAGLLPRASATLLTAREKAGKGLLALDLCAAVAAGEPFLGRPTKQGTAVYCAAEEHLSLLRDRLASRFGDPAAWPDLPMGVLSLAGDTEDRLRLEDPAEFARLAATVRELRPSVLVLDTLRELHGASEDRSDEMGPLLRPLRQLAHQSGAALVVNHHQNKGQEFRGSTAIRAAFDQEWAFHRTDRSAADGGGEGGRVAGVLTVEGRYGAKQRLRIALGAGLRWTVATEGETGPRASSVRARLCFVLADRPDGATADEIARELGVSTRSVQQAIAEMLAQTPPAVVASGSGVRSDPRRFRLAIPDGVDSSAAIQTALPRWWDGASGNLSQSPD